MMSRATFLLPWRWLAMTMVLVLATSASFAASSGTDNAGNYTPATFTNGANEGTGFGPWQFNVGEGALVALTNATVGGGDINSTNDLSFMFYGGTNGSYGEATRDFNAPMVEGDVFSVNLSYDWNGGNRGLDVYNASGAQLLNINYGGADTLNLTFAGESAVDITTDYAADTILQVTIEQDAGNQLDVVITRVNDGYTTNLISTGLSSPAARVKFYNGGHAGDSLDYALFVNDLTLTASTLPTLGLSGRDAMAAGMTNVLTVTRGGVINTQSVVTIGNSDSNVAATPASVTLEDGDAVTNFPVEGLALGMTTIDLAADGYPAASLDVTVYDLGYDDSSYAGEANAFTNEGNSGLGFGPWILINNDGAGDGYTNFAGAFIGDSTANSGGDVNASSGDAFGLYANQQGSGDAPFINAIRPFGADMVPGEVVSLEFGVNFRNGSKGVAFQNSGSTVFEVGVFADDYWYVNPSVTSAPVSLGWSYAADTAISVELEKLSGSLYNIVIVRSGSAPETNDLGTVDLGTTAPNEVRFYVFATEGGGENNLYFNRLARYSGEELAVLSIDGFDGQIVDSTNVFTVTRTGSTNDALTVTLDSSDPAVASVSASVEIPAGASSATFEVVGLSNGLVSVSAAATGVIGTAFDVEVFDIAYDDTSYYPPATFDGAGNGGYGFTNWVIAANDGPGDGFTNFVGAFIGAAASDMNSSDGTAFGLYANGDGIDGDAPLAEATRAFNAELGVGESVVFSMGVNFRNGAKGVMIQNGGSWLLEIAVFGDDYWYNVRDGGADSPVSLGWAYASDTVISVVLSRTGANDYNLRLVREGSTPEDLLVEGITLSQAPDRLRFYVFDTDSGDENNLYVNDLAIYTGTVGVELTDGIPNSWWDQYSIDPLDRIAGNDLDVDGSSNWEEYIADTNPDDDLAFYPNRVESLVGAGVVALETGPTTNSRVYDVWWTTDLLADPQVWTRYGLSVPGDALGSNVILQVTNDAPFRIYRTGVALP